MCPCARDGACEGGSLSCLANRCVQTNCTVGEAGCLCSEGTCLNGAECRLSVCRSPDSVSVEVSSGTNVRACDVVLTIPAVARASVTFVERVRGQSLQRSGALALSFIQPPVIGNPPGLAGRVATVSTAGMGLPKLLRSECYDALGNTIQNVQIVVR